MTKFTIDSLNSIYVILLLKLAKNLRALYFKVKFSILTITILSWQIYPNLLLLLLTTDITMKVVSLVRESLSL